MLLLLLLSLNAEAAVLRQTGVLTVSSCVNNGNPFKPDACRPQSRATCVVGNEGKRISFSAGRIAQVGRIDNAYEINERESRHQILGLPGLFAGTVFLGRANARPTMAEIYKNADASGHVYTLYRCENLK